MDFKIEKIGDSVAVAAVEGPLDVISGPALRESVTQALAEGVTRLILDLESVTFMDNSGVRELVTSLLHIRRQGGVMALVKPNHKVRMKLMLLSLYTVFSIYSDVNTAMMYV